MLWLISSYLFLLHIAVAVGVWFLAQHPPWHLVAAGAWALATVWLSVSTLVVARLPRLLRPVCLLVWQLPVLACGAWNIAWLLGHAPAPPAAVQKLPELWFTPFAPLLAHLPQTPMAGISLHAWTVQGLPAAVVVGLGLWSLMVSPAKKAAGKEGGDEPKTGKKEKKDKK